MMDEKNGLEPLYQRIDLCYFSKATVLPIDDGDIFIIIPHKLWTRRESNAGLFVANEAFYH